MIGLTAARDCGRFKHLLICCVWCHWKKTEQENIIVIIIMTPLHLWDALFFICEASGSFLKSEASTRVALEWQNLGLDLGLVSKDTWNVSWTRGLGLLKDLHFCWLTGAPPLVEPFCRAVYRSSPSLDCWGRTTPLWTYTPRQRAAKKHIQWVSNFSGLWILYIFLTRILLCYSIY